MKNQRLPALILCIAPFVMALKSDTSKIAHVTADSVYYNNKTGIAKYTGHVRATQGTTRVQADQVTLYRNAQNDIEKIVATGKPAHYFTQPDKQKDLLHASANTIEYYPIQGKILLIDNGLAVIGRNRFSANHISYDINKELLISDNSHQGQTKIVLEPNHHRSASKLSKRHL